MTISELKKKIAEANDIEWFNTVQETFDFFYSDFTQTFTGVSAIYEFVNQQLNGWIEYKDSIPSDLSNSLTYFQRINDQIIYFVNNYHTQEKYYLDNYWQQIRNQIKELYQRPLCYNSSYTEFLIKVSTNTPLYFQGAFNTLLETNNYNVNSREFLYGALLAYEFTFKSKSGIFKRRDAEQKSLSQLKSDFQNYLSESEKIVIDHIQKTNETFSEFTKKIDNLKTEKEATFNEWFENTKNENWEKWYDDKKDKIQKLEDAYDAKLKLEKPARYWQAKSTKYYEQGKIARNIILGIVGAVSFFLGTILISSPDWIFKTVFKNNSTAIVRWSIVLIIFISLIAYTIKALTKYMFSSYHLARDAEERHTLTFFYLALIKDTEVNSEDRNLILQSLFSRSDTGLLKEDSSPTMPSEAISKFVTRS